MKYREKYEHVPYLESWKFCHELNTHTQKKRFLDSETDANQQKREEQKKNKWYPTTWNEDNGNFAARFEIYIIYNIYESSLHMKLPAAYKAIFRKTAKKE